ncbi:hypothetical protein [Agrobacterium sp. 22117]|uniref:hypothetical protein n=1 Tax=Agrobacterium sp. 22117 TaxID=3453880 RepID=UPI003F827EED
MIFLRSAMVILSVQSALRSFGRTKEALTLSIHASSFSKNRVRFSADAVSHVFSSWFDRLVNGLPKTGGFADAAFLRFGHHVTIWQ